MGIIFKARRGLQSRLPTLSEGEIGFTTDQKRLYIGTGTENVEYAQAATVVQTTGNQTIAGAKTFSSNVIVPATPTANTHATSKQYVDTALAEKANLSELPDMKNVVVNNGSGATAIAIGPRTISDGVNSASFGIDSAAQSTGALALGYYASVLGSYSTAIGNAASIAQSESAVMQLGSNNSLSVLRCRVDLSVTSDARDKADIVPIRAALDFIRQVQPIQYVSNERVKYLPPEEERTDEQQELMRKYGLCRCYDEQAHATGQQKGERKRVGVSAQQVQEALAAVYGSADYANIVNDNLHDVAQREELPEGVESQLTVNYSGFVPFLIQAVQELARRVEELEGS